MEHEYYKEYYELERHHWWFKAREYLLQHHIAKRLAGTAGAGKNIRILNVGCGTGRSSEYLSAFGEVTSLEYDAFCCEFTRQKTGLDIIQGSVTELPFADQSFDLVCAFDVIEHVERDDIAVKEMHRVCKPGGVLFVTVPACMSLWSQHDEVNHHFRRYTRPQLQKVFTGVKGKEIFSSYFNSFLFLPIYVFRRLSTLFKTSKSQNGSGSDFGTFNPGLVNTLLYMLMKSENLFLSRNIRFPAGVSIMMSFQKAN